MSKVSIVGSNGYIERNLFYHLDQRDDIEQIALYDCLDESVDKNEKYFKVNLPDRDDVKKIDFDCDIIFFMAGKTGTFSGFNNYSDFISVNEFGLLNFIDEYRIQGSKAKIIFPSTRLVYKGSDIPVSEDSPIELKTIYAVNKFACENYLKQYSQIFGIKYCVFRICVPYGTRIWGLVFRTTQNIGNVPVTHRKREDGKSGYTLTKLISLWMNGFTAFSIKPLRVASILGILTAFIGFGFGIFTIINKIINPEIAVGYSSLMAVLLFIGGMLMIMLGLIGEYIGRIYISINNSPQYVISETVNVSRN